MLISELAEKVTLEKLGDANVLTHPARASIIKYLQKEGRADISQISKAIKLDKDRIGFHILRLSKKGFVDGDYALKGKRAVRDYEITPKVKKTIDFLTEYFKEK